MNINYIYDLAVSCFSCCFWRFRLPGVLEGVKTDRATWEINEAALRDEVACISHKVFIKVSWNSELPHKSVNLSFIIRPCPILVGTLSMAKTTKLQIKMS